MKNLSKNLGGLGALLICLPVIWQIHEGSRFNPASYLLWSILSLVTTIVLIRAKGGGYVLMIGYIFSDLAIGLYAYHKSGQTEFGKFEFMIAGLALICTSLYVWCEIRQNFTPAVITNTIALFIAGIPQIVDSYRKPENVSFFIG